MRQNCCVRGNSETPTLSWLINNHRANRSSTSCSRLQGSERKHVGDYTLFMTGLFLEGVAKASRGKRPRLDAFVDFVQTGKESYSIVSSFDQFECRSETPLFRRISSCARLG